MKERRSVCHTCINWAVTRRVLPYVGYIGVRGPKCYGCIVVSRGRFSPFWSEISLKCQLSPVLSRIPGIRLRAGDD